MISAEYLEKTLDQITDAAKKLPLKSLMSEYAYAKEATKAATPDYTSEDQITYSVSQMMVRTIVNGAKLIPPKELGDYLNYLKSKSIPVSKTE